MKNVLFTNFPGVRQVNDNCIILEVLLPKGWELSDFDKVDNLIEIEDIKDGRKFWVAPGQLLRFIPDAQIGKKLKVVNLDKGIMVDSWIEKFADETRRNRCYLQAIIRPFGKIETADRKNVYAKIQHLEYEGLYVPAPFDTDNELHSF